MADILALDQAEPSDCQQQTVAALLPGAVLQTSCLEDSAQGLATPLRASVAAAWSACATWQIAQAAPAHKGVISACMCCGKQAKRLL